MTQFKLNAYALNESGELDNIIVIGEKSQVFAKKFSLMAQLAIKGIYLTNVNDFECTGPNDIFIKIAELDFVGYEIVNYIDDTVSKLVNFESFDAMMDKLSQTLDVYDCLPSFEVTKQGDNRWYVQYAITITDGEENIVSKDDVALEISLLRESDLAIK